MNILLLKGFNNYFNRIVKKYSTLADYKNNSSSFLNFSNINFNPNDGVTTELIIGNATQNEGDQDLFWEFNGTPDYLVAYDTGDNTDIIRFRWFVLESERTRRGQYRIALKRDVLADHFTEVLTAPCFVEKGIIKDKTNPLLYNNESMTYNQIKQEEYLLKDSTNSAWIVGYYAKNYDPTGSGTAVSTDMAITDGVPAEYYDEEDLPFGVNPDASTTVYSYTPDTFSVMLPLVYFKNGGWGNFYINQGFNFVGYNQTSDKNFIMSINKTELGIATERIGETADPAQVISNANCDVFRSTTAGWGRQYDISSGDGVQRFRIVPNFSNTRINLVGNKYFYTWDQPLNHDQNRQAPVSVIEPISSSDISSTYSNAVKTVVNNKMLALASSADRMYGNIESYNNKYVKIGTNYYRISVNKLNKDYYDFWIPSTNSGNMTITSLDNNITEIHNSSDFNTPIANLLTNIQNNNSGYILANTTEMGGAGAITVSSGYSVVLSQISVETLSVTLHNNKRITYDCPANIFAIPYGSLKFKTSSNGSTYTTDPNEGLALARAIAEKMGANVCYDLQLLPYVPSALVRDLMGESDTLLLTDLENANYEVASRTFLGTTSTATFVLYPSSCKGSFDITQVLNPMPLDNYSDSLRYKISNETEICRLVAPNYNGMFEFSLAKNNGITKINVDYTYKPYQPYIHMNPDFKGIYGQDWDDSRGLICGGDYSLTFINDAWQTYQNNNKNYQAIFNRQIENLDVNNQIAREQQDFQRIMGYFGGGIGGAAGGALTGAKVGGGYGAIAGAIGGAYMGTVGSIIGGDLDREWLLRQQAEAKDYTIDMYGYQLGNIKAMPYSLARSEALTNNNKVWPLIELYRCTSQEITNLINKIAYNGMTVMVTDKLENYVSSDDFSIVYAKGQLVRIENINDDFHVVDAIYQEVNKGFFVIQGE